MRSTSSRIPLVASGVWLDAARFSSAIWRSWLIPVAKPASLSAR